MSGTHCATFDADVNLPLLKKAPGSTAPPLCSNTHIGVASAKRVRKKQREHFAVAMAGVSPCGHNTMQVAFYV